MAESYGQIAATARFHMYAPLLTAFSRERLHALAMPTPKPWLINFFQRARSG